MITTRAVHRAVDYDFSIRVTVMDSVRRMESVEFEAELLNLEPIHDSYLLMLSASQARMNLDDNLEAFKSGVGRVSDH